MAFAPVPVVKTNVRATRELVIQLDPFKVYPVTQLLQLSGLFTQVAHGV